MVFSGNNAANTLTFLQVLLTYITSNSEFQMKKSEKQQSSQNNSIRSPVPVKICCTECIYCICKSVFHQLLILNTDITSEAAWQASKFSFLKLDQVPTSKMGTLHLTSLMFWHGQGNSGGCLLCVVFCMAKMSQTAAFNAWQFHGPFSYYLQSSCLNEHSPIISDSQLNI